MLTCPGFAIQGERNGETHKVNIADIGVDLCAVVGELAEIPSEIVVWVRCVAHGWLN
jgi:hypothetical protein